MDKITDKELFRRMNKAEKEYDEYRMEYLSRGLNKRPYCELSALSASQKTQEFRNGVWQRKLDKDGE